jgi:hypothetical protein
MTSEISSPATLVRFNISFKTVSPSLWAGTEASVPLKEPTGVRTADTITTSFSEVMISLHWFQEPWF